MISIHECIVQTRNAESIVTNTENNEKILNIKHRKDPEDR